VGASLDARIESVPVTAVWERLERDDKAVLVDVRTHAEWTYVGVADLSSIGKKPILFEWQSYPDGKVDPAFAERLSNILDSSGVQKDAQIFFICRSGVRSKAAARTMIEAGYQHCHNVADGFEGPMDPSRQRGRLAGWKAAGLAWVQG
jgi:rhodanese-related sulfurtransferase